MAGKPVRVRCEVEGFVQGVGFRPFVYQLAERFGLAGFVRNTSQGAVLEVEGTANDLDLFFSTLIDDLPPLAGITRLTQTPIPGHGQIGFKIDLSQARSTRTALISPDVAVCPDCLRELADPRDRRYRYPFINCTNCGPRYTIIEDVPYDRDKTSMRTFKMCAACQAEYDNPADRRFHAQPNACPECGPRTELVDAAGRIVPTADPVSEAAQLIRTGKIVAVKGLGGFHLTVNAFEPSAVERLRRRKHREEKPLAVMSPDLEVIRRYALLNDDEIRVLESRQRPIVLLEARRPSPLAPNVSPDNRYVGVFLPYTPLHHLLLEHLPAVVMTSGNLTDEPIAVDNEEALARLGEIADYFLRHDRDIYLRADDSVVRVSGTRTRQIRRSRGFAPAPVILKQSIPPVLAVGGELKNTVCLAKGDRAFISQHIGDLENQAALDSFARAIEHLRRILDIEPEAVAHDLHPGYLSTRWALEESGLEAIGIQHHHAHVVSGMAEHGLTGPVIGLACDGTGYGTDGHIWGGELLLVDGFRFERRGHLEYLPLPGGEAAIREPWRMAVACLKNAHGALPDTDLIRRQEPSQLNLLTQMIDKKINSPLTSSLGRLFDAVAALAGLRDRVAFEGQAAMMLEMICPDGDFRPYPYELDTSANQWILRSGPLFRALLADLEKAPAGAISARFHRTIVEALVEMATRLSKETGVRQVVLSGGCFQNQVLTDGLTAGLARRGLTVFSQDKVPANDGGLSLGQALAAGLRLADLTPKRPLSRR